MALNLQLKLQAQFLKIPFKKINLSVYNSCLINQNPPSNILNELFKTTFCGKHMVQKSSYFSLCLIFPKCYATNISNKFHLKSTKSLFNYSVKSLITSSRPISTSAFVKCTNQGNSHMQPSTSRRSTLYYIIAVGILCVGLSYAAVPLYRIFCQAYSYGGTTQQLDMSASKVEFLQRRQERIITIRFNADISASMTWNFKPLQVEIKVVPGETALAFYSARNPTDRPVIGVSTYNVIPFDAGQYFNKIQCFCFEEQMLNPKEEVSMPVFFYIDPEFADDPKMENVDDITLSYTFFEVKEGMQLPIPNFIKH